MKVRKAVIPAAGLGTRFLPATKAVPKEMIPIIEQNKTCLKARIYGQLASILAIATAVKIWVIAGGGFVL